MTDVVPKQAIYINWLWVYLPQIVVLMISRGRFCSGKSEAMHIGRRNWWKNNV